MGKTERLLPKEREVLVGAKLVRSGTFRPWRGYSATAARLAKAGLLKEARVSVTYVITDAGRKALEPTP